jgi:hypothetical protein
VSRIGSSDSVPTHARHGPTLGTGQQIPLDRAQSRREATVGLRTFKGFDAVAAGQDREDHRQHRLEVQPTRTAQVPQDRHAEPARMDQIETPISISAMLSQLACLRG